MIFAFAVFSFIFFIVACLKVIPICVQHSKIRKSLRRIGAKAEKSNLLSPVKFQEYVVSLMCAMLHNNPSGHLDVKSLQVVVDYINACPKECRENCFDILEDYTHREFGPAINRQRLKDGEKDANLIIKNSAFTGEYDKTFEKSDVEPIILALSAMLDEPHRYYLGYLLFLVASADGKVSIHVSGYEKFGSMTELETLKWMTEQLNLPGSYTSSLFHSFVHGGLPRWYQDNVMCKPNAPAYGTVTDAYPSVDLAACSDSQPLQNLFDKLDIVKLNKRINFYLLFPSLIAELLFAILSIPLLFDTLKYRVAVYFVLLFIMVAYTAIAKYISDERQFKAYVSKSIFNCCLRTVLLFPLLFSLEGELLCTVTNFNYKTDKFSLTRKIEPIGTRSGRSVYQITPALSTGDAEMNPKVKYPSEIDSLFVRYLPMLFGGLYNFSSGDEGECLYTVESENPARFDSVEYRIYKGCYGYYELSLASFK